MHQQESIPSHKHEQEQAFAYESDSLPMPIHFLASTNGDNDADRHREQNHLDWQQLSFLSDQQSHSEEPRWAQSLPSRGRSRNDEQQLPGLWAHWGKRANAGGKQQQQPQPWPGANVGSSNSEHEQTPPRLVTMDPLAGGKKGSVDATIKQRQQQVAFPLFSSTSRSNQQPTPTIGSANFEDRNNGWWSDNGRGIAVISGVVRHRGETASIEVRAW